MTPARHRPPRPAAARGFTLIELLVVIGIIVLLAAILMPVVSSVRRAAFDTSTQAQMQRIMQACESYYHDFNAYPGPVSNVFLYGNTVNNGKPDPLAPTNVTGQITSSENLVLGLLGYLDPGTTTANPSFNSAGASTMNPPGPPAHDIISLGQITTGNRDTRSFHYLDYTPGELSNGPANSLAALSGFTTLADSTVPEFIDRFPDPLPILYLRAYPGATGIPQANAGDVMGGGTAAQTFVQYNFLELSAYGCNVFGGTPLGPQALLLDVNYFKTLNGYVTTGTLSSDVATPYLDWNGMTPVSGTNPPSFSGYLTNPNIGGGGSQTTNGGAVRGKDGFILISAGKDRVYGTVDDTIVTP